MVSNPFSTCHIRPGAMPFLYRAGEDAETLLARLRSNRWQGEIIGPHGTGKSALLAELVPAIQRAGQRPLWITLHDGQRRLPPEAKRELRLRPPTLLAIDGYEQLGRWSRFRLRRHCRRRKLGLLNTAHNTPGLPELHRAAADAELFSRIVRQLLAGQPCPWNSFDLAEQFARHGGNLREALFELYDLYERQPTAKRQNLT